MNALNQWQCCYKANTSEDLSHHENDGDKPQAPETEHTGGVLKKAHEAAVANSDGIPGDPTVVINVDDDEDDAISHHEQLSNRRAQMRSLTANTPEAQEVIVKLTAALDDYARLIKQAREANHDYFPCEFASNFLSGMTGFLLCFGAGTLTSSALEKPVLGWAISTVTWALGERFVPMSRNTTWDNVHADTTYPLLGNLIQQAARDAVRKLAGIGPRQAANQTSQPSLSEINFFEAWRGKAITDDLPYYFYTLCYGVRYSIIAGMNLPPTAPASLISLLVAGTLAGAFTAITTHYARRRQYQARHGDDQFKGQKITRTLEMWKKVVEILENESKLLNLYSTSYGSDLTKKQKNDLQIKKENIDNAIIKARKKANAPTSLLFEITVLFGLSRSMGDRRGEVAGKLSEFIAGILAKGSVLGISTGWNYAFTMKMLASTSSIAARTGFVWTQNAMLIFAFNFRKEAELAYRGLIGVGLGISDIAKKQIYGFAPGENDNPQDGGFATERGGASIRSVGSTQELGAEYRQRKLDEKKIGNQLTSIDGDERDYNDDEVLTTVVEDDSSHGAHHATSLVKEGVGKGKNPSSPPNTLQSNHNTERQGLKEKPDIERGSTESPKKINKSPSVDVKLDFSSSHSESSD